MNEESARNRTLSILCHVAALFSSTVICIGVPIAVLLTSTDEVVIANAKASLNFQINLFIWAIIGCVLMFVLVGFLILFAAAVASVVMPLVAIVQVCQKPDVPYQYRWTLKIL